MSVSIKNLRKTWPSLLRVVLQTAFLTASVFSLLYLDFTLIAVIMAVSLLGGAWFCGWVCPFGSAQDWISSLGRRVFKRRLKIPPRIEKYLSLLRYVLLALSLAGFSYTAFLSRPYQNFSGLLSGHTAYVGWT
jgi:polyferredoxin